MLKNIFFSYKFLFFTIVLFYSFFLSQFGFENFDTGYITSFSWRIINGENPYEDFFYKGPPVTLYFHAFFLKILPITGQFFFVRVINYLLFSFQVFLFVSSVFNLYNDQKVNRWGIISICFIVSLLNFSPYPWPTTDGLLFASIAFFLVSSKTETNFINLFIVAFFTLLCALTKQSFYLIPLVFLIWVFIRFGLKRSLVFLIQLIILLFIYLFLISRTTSLSNYFQQTTGETHLHDIYKVGVLNYMPFSSKIILILIIILSIVFFYCYKFQKNIFKSLLLQLRYIPYTLFAVAILLIILQNALTASRIGFIASVFTVVYAFFIRKETIQMLFPLIVLLSIAWSSSISLGYPYPILFSTGILLVYIVVFEKNINLKPNFLLGISILVGFSAFSYNLRPYREKNITELNTDLSPISPKLKWIKSSRITFEKNNELKQLIEKYGDKFIVAPSSPMTNYIFNNKSELPTDWIINTEVNRKNNLFINLCAKPENYIFLERSFLEKEEFIPDNIADFSYIAWFIHKNFKPIETTKYFIVYNSLKENEKLP